MGNGAERPGLLTVSARDPRQDGLPGLRDSGRGELLTPSGLFIESRGETKIEGNAADNGPLVVATDSGARFVQQSTVSEDELEGYEMWLEAEGGYF